MPSTTRGRWAGWLLATALASFLLFATMVAAGQRGGDSFFSNLWLTGPMVAAALAAMCGGCVGVSAVRQGDRSPIVMMAITIGTAVAIYFAVEIAFPH